MVFGVLLDGSKAFYRINHRKLIMKLVELNVPNYIVILIQHWYKIQCIKIMWNDCFSEQFNVSIGIRQGSILSPLSGPSREEKSAGARCFHGPPNRSAPLPPPPLPSPIPF